MVIQIFGTLKCKDTQKAIRFFKERKIQPHFVDLNEKAISKGELNNISRSVPLENLINRDSKEFKKKGLEFMIFDIEETLLENPLLFKTPVVRQEKKATIGYEPEIWKNWLKD
ncbi:MAG: ArsC/Spx/MgsR family protein [bacterium]